MQPDKHRTQKKEERRSRPSGNFRAKSPQTRHRLGKPCLSNWKLTHAHAQLYTHVGATLHACQLQNCACQSINFSTSLSLSFFLSFEFRAKRGCSTQLAANRLRALSLSSLFALRSHCAVVLRSFCSQSFCEGSSLWSLRPALSLWTRRVPARRKLKSLLPTANIACI